MLAARMHEYQKPLILEQVQEAKNLSGENILVKVGGQEFVVLMYKWSTDISESILISNYLVRLVMKSQDGLKRLVIQFLKILSKKVI
jgi:hypothetical protein